MNDENDMGARRSIDLRRLPRWIATTVAVVVTVAIVGIAWLVGRDEPTPRWIMDVLIPVLGWTWLVLAAVALFTWPLRRRRRS